MSNTPPDDDDPPPPAPIQAPSRAEIPPEDIPNALRFLHLVDLETRARVSDLSATLQSVLETLIGTGQLPLEVYETRKRLTMARESERAQSQAGVMISNIPDKYAVSELPQIDCAARLHLCKARCCSFSFALSVQDLDERIVRWNYGAPYKIAQRSDGFCVHHEPGGQCGVYANRPGVCRKYDCRTDPRIWADFEKRIPAA